MTTISPSLFILAWMAVISCIMQPAESLSPVGALTLVASVVASLLAMLSEAGALESEDRDGKRSMDVFLQVVALSAFIARVGVFCWSRA